MRARLALLLFFLCAFPLLAQEVEFELTLGTVRTERNITLIPVTLSIPVDELRFVDDGAELAAKVSVLQVDGNRVTRVIEESRRIAAPGGTVPQGGAKYRFELAAGLPQMTITIKVVDLNSGLAGTRSISVDGTTAHVLEVSEASSSDTAWPEALARAKSEKKPIVVFFRSRPCARCREFEQVSVPHPAIQRRLPNVVFATLPANAGEASKLWSAEAPGVALFDRSGVLRARWPNVPDTMNFDIILDSVIAVAPHLERAVQLAEAGGPHDGDAEVAIGLARLGRITAARAALASARANGKPETKQSAIIAGALLDANDGKSASALAELRQIVASALTPKLAGDAWMAIGTIQQASGATDEAIGALTTAARLLEAGSPAHTAARQALASLRAARTTEPDAIRILPLGRQIITGRQTVKTHVASAAVARVTFSLDGREVARVTRPPFSTTLDFGTVPERRSIAVVAFDRKGQESAARARGQRGRRDVLAPAGRASRRPRRRIGARNDERPYIGHAPRSAGGRLMERRRAHGARRCAMANDHQHSRRPGRRAPRGGRAGRRPQLGGCGAAERERHGRPVERAAGRAPITILSRNGPPPVITSDRITVREGNKVRRVESISTAAETPLTVGLLIDASDSMQKTLPDLQEAAIRFLETILGDRDRAFLVAFDTRARLLQPATSDTALLRRQIMTIQPDGLTALNDAMAVGLLQFEGIKGRRAMVVFTDGVDRTSRYTATEVSELAKRVNVPIHVIAAVPWIPASGGTGGTWMAEANEQLNAVAQTTGGTSHTLTALPELPTVYAQIEAALRAQILAFVRIDPGTRENEWRSVQVEVGGQDLEAHAPEGYYAPW
jgi:Ca-activated chloride channel family protein